MKTLTDNQVRHLRRVIENPGEVPSGTCLGDGWNARTFASLRTRGLIRSDDSTSWRYVPTIGGLCTVAMLDAAKEASRDRYL